MKAAGFTHDNKDNASVDWYTPPWVFQRIGLDFDLDPCQPPDGIDWIPAKRRYSIHDDGLTQPWNGRVWLNPPYGKHTPAWLERMHKHRNGIALVFARTDCAWFHESVRRQTIGGCSESELRSQSPARGCKAHFPVHWV